MSPAASPGGACLSFTAWAADGGCRRRPGRGGSGSEGGTRKGRSREPRAHSAAQTERGRPALGLPGRAAPGGEEAMLMRRPAPLLGHCQAAPTPGPAPPRPAPGKSPPSAWRGSSSLPRNPNPKVRPSQPVAPRSWAARFPAAAFFGGVAHPNSLPLSECAGRQRTSPLTLAPRGSARAPEAAGVPLPTPTPICPGCLG